MNKILFILPTKGRPARLQECLEQYEKNTINNVTQLCIVIDEDEKELYAHLDLSKYIVHYLPSMMLVPKLNSVANMYVSSYKYIGFLADDIYLDTKDWDIEYFNALEEIEGYGIVYGNDTVTDGHLPNTPAMHSEMIKRLGYFCIPGLKHLFMDNGHKVLGERTNLVYLPDTRVVHKHWIKEGHLMDATYEISKNNEVWTHDQDVFNLWLNHIEDEIKKLR